MADLIVKLAPDCYVEWSTVVDAPVTPTLTLSQLWEYIRAEYGNAGAERLPERLARCEQHGTSSVNGTTVDELLSCNRAGPKESHITRAEIVRRYRPTDSPGTQEER
jgi:hypothetical protein